MAQTRQSLSHRFSSESTADESIHQTTLSTLAKAAQGKPFILDDAPLRMMYLTPDCMQSVMRIDDPTHLLCDYSRTMMGLVLFNPQPRHIVLIGLGGGSLVKYCYQHFPECRITAVEINADVIAMREQFMIPADNQRLNIIHADAVDWLPQQQGDADVIFLDAYDINGLVPALNNKDFYATCYKQLNKGGILVANVWGKPSTLAPMLTMLHQQFLHQVGWAKSADSYNLLVFSVKESDAIVDAVTQQQVADSLIENHPTLELGALIKKLKSLGYQKQASIPESQLSAALLKSLRSIMVSDANVPQNYAEFKALMLPTPTDSSRY